MDTLMFVLPVSGGSGGAHSVMQEADAMRDLGINAIIATNHANVTKLRRAYRDLKTIHNFVFSYTNPETLGQLIATHKPRCVIATTNQSVHYLADALRAAKMLDQPTAYYVQDYEPLFYERGSADWHTAYSSFTAIPGMTLFAKTRWLQEVVAANHNVQVEKVEPSIDHKVYYPNLGSKGEDKRPLAVAAMIRPATPRRSPRRTARIISRIVKEYAGQVSCTTFGCGMDEMRDFSIRIPGAEHVGILNREEVGDLFRSTDMFLDLSDFQAFGRTAIEAMSCGSAAIVPAHGGTYEYAIDGKNCFVVDVRSDEAIMAAFGQWVSMAAEERRAMSFRAIEAGYAYSPDRAALSELRVLLEA